MAYGTVFPIIVLLLACSLSIGAGDDPALSALFEQRGLTGTLLIESLDGQSSHVHNETRAQTRFIPASTFKIPNTLIALHEGAVSDEHQIIKWDGETHSFPDWNRDQTMQSAFKSSCVWFYQALARRVGNEAYLRHFKKLGYGNMLTGPELDRFWLEGDIRISAREQLAFMRRLVEENLPYRKDHIQMLKRIMLVLKGSDYTLRAKTGWAIRVSQQIGWYVGWLEKENGEVWLFAINFDGDFQKDARYRQEIVMTAFTAKHII